MLSVLALNSVVAFRLVPGLRLFSLPVVLSKMLQLPVERWNNCYLCRVSLALVCRSLRQVDLHPLATACRNTGVMLSIRKTVLALVM